MDKTEKREALILEQLHRSGKLTIKEIAHQFSVSEPTARRISSSLAAKHKVLRTHGGIRYLPGSEFEYSFDVLKNKYIDEKKRIAKYAATLIHDNDIVFLEAGTTIHQLAIALAERLRKKELSNVMVFTNSLDNLNILSSLCKVIVIGGEYRTKRRDFSGYISEKMLKYLSFKYCFIGADAINIDEGVMASDVDTVRFDELLIARSQSTIVLVDSSKFKNQSLVSYASADEIAMIITDERLSQSDKSGYRKKGVDIRCV